MTVETMSASDASFLHIEDGRTHMHIGSAAIFEGPPPPYEELLAMIGSKLPAVRRYRQRVRFGPFGLVRPVWADDPHFNLGYHVRHTALPGDGDENDLRRLASRIMSQSLDRSKPLWEVWMVEGLPDDRWALVSKVHHCMVDGVAVDRPAVGDARRRCHAAAPTTGARRPSRTRLRSRWPACRRSRSTRARPPWPRSRWCARRATRWPRWASSPARAARPCGPCGRSSRR